MEPEKLHTTGKARPAAEAAGAAGSLARSTARARYQGYVRHKWLVLAITAAICVVLLLASVMVGSSGLTIGQVIAAIFGGGDDQTRMIVWKLRMPHALTAVVGGVALALAGCVFQSVLRNPLASASTLGVAQGAAFGASVAIIVLGAGGGAVAGAASAQVVGTVAASSFEGIMFSNPYVTAICAFIGAMLSTLIILLLSRFRDLTPESIVLAGVALSALFAGCTAMLQYFAEDTQVAAVVFWTFGSLRRVTYKELGIMAAVTIACAVYFHLNRWNYNAMESGEGSAHGLGVNVKGVRVAGMVVATLAASTVIAFCGTINFVGLVAPHIMRRFIGSDYRYLLPASALAGAALLLVSDLIASTVVASAVLPISAITSFVGAPLFLYLLMKRAH